MYRSTDPTGGSLESALRSWIDDFLSISLVLHGRLDVASIEHVQHDQVSTDGGKIEEEEAIIHSSSLKRADSSVSAGDWLSVVEYFCRSFDSSVLVGMNYWRYFFI